MAKRLILIFIALSFNSLIGQNSPNSGTVIYQVSLTEPYFYSQEYQLEDPVSYKDRLKTDSLITNIEIGIVFKNNFSNSFLTKKYVAGSNNEYAALHRINGTGNYLFDALNGLTVIDIEYWLSPIIIEVNLEEKWDVDLNTTKNIDGYKCFKAIYKGQHLWWHIKESEAIYAWFSPDIPLPFGPLNYNGLPGLILELNVENVRFSATKIDFNKPDPVLFNRIDYKNKKLYSEIEFLKERDNLKRKAKKIMIGG